MDLQIKLKQSAIIDFNQDKLEKNIKEIEKKFSGLVVTEDNLSDVAKTRASINKLSAEIHERYKDVKKQVLSPLDQFEINVKEARKRLEILYRSIKDQEDAYEQKRRNEVEKKLIEIKARIVLAFEINSEFEELIIIKDKYLIKTANRKVIIQELEEQADKVAALQKTEEQRKKVQIEKQKMIGQYCDLYTDKFSLNHPLQSIDFTHLLDADISEIPAQIEKIAKLNHEKELELTSKREHVEETNSKPSMTRPVEQLSTIDLRLYTTSSQRVQLTNFLKQNDIKFELIKSQEAA